MKDECILDYKEHKEAIKGGNKKKLIHNIQQKKKKCQANEEPNVEKWRVKSSNVEKIKKITTEDIKKSKFLKTILQENDINYNQQEYAFWLATKLEFNFTKEFDKDINYVKILAKHI